MSRNLIIGVIVAAIVVAGVAIGLSVGLKGDDDDSGGGGGTTTTATSTTAAAEMFAGIAQKDTVLGDPDAPVKILEFADIQCPFCKQASTDVIPTLVKDYVKPGDASIEFVSIAFIGADSERGAIAVEAAGEQGKAWEMAEALYAEQGGENDGWLSDDLVMDTAREIGLDMDAFEAAYSGDAAAQSILDNSDRASTEGVSSTPTYVVEGPNGQEVVPGADLAAIQKAIDKVQG